MEIKTLAEILAENDLAISDKTGENPEKQSPKNQISNNQKSKNQKNNQTKIRQTNATAKPYPLINPLSSKSQQQTKAKHSYPVSISSDISLAVNPKSQTEQVDNNQAIDKKSTLDNISDKLKEHLKTSEQRQDEVNEIKADSRLRWLAFYYLSTREHSAEELKRKLLAKQQNPEKVDELLVEFAKKSYQSDMRAALMLIREGIRKGRGRRRIKQDFFKRQISLPANIDELIDMANEESDEFADYIDDTDDTKAQSVNWLKQAVQARVKKYGDEIPTATKDKAKQLRFLQYRGFVSEICFEAIKHNMSTLADN